MSGDKEKAESWADEWNAKRGITYSDFHDGAATDDYDAIYVATPNGLHLDAIETAAEYGKHTLCEKPLEISVDRAETAVQLCEDSNITLMTAYRLQADPVIRRVREMITSGYIGQPISFHSEFAIRTLDLHDADNFRYESELSGGGALMDIGVYPINTARFILDRDPIRISGTTGWNDPAFSDVDEYVAFQLTFPDDVSGLCSCTFDGQPYSTLEVMGTDGRLRITNPFEPNTRRTVTVVTDDGKAVVQPRAMNELREQFDYFAYHILTNQTPGPDGVDGLTDVEITTAIYESADGNELVSL